MKDMEWRAWCEPCKWKTDLMSAAQADKAAREHDRQEHEGQRVAMRVSEDGQVVA